MQGKAVKGQPAKKPKPKPDPNPNVIKITNKEQLQKLKGTKLNEQMKAWGVPIGKGEAALVDAKRARLVAKFEQEEAKKIVKAEERKKMTRKKRRMCMRTSNGQTTKFKLCLLFIPRKSHAVNRGWRIC